MPMEQMSKSGRYTLEEWNRNRLEGEVSVTFPDRGFFWIAGTDGIRYFAHQSKVLGGYSIFDMWEHQKCTFFAEADERGRGPRAVMIEMAGR